MEHPDKKEYIAEVAERLFAVNGFNGTSVRDIAKEAGVNIAMISYYFGSKENLLAAVFIQRAQGIKLQIEEIISDVKLTHMERVFKLIDTYLLRIMKHPNFHRIMVREQLGKREGKVHEMIRETKQNNQKLVRKIIEDGQKAGVFKKNVDIPLMMTTLFGTTNQLITTQHYYKEINKLEKLSDQEFEKYITKKLSAHLKTIFKAILTNED